MGDDKGGQRSESIRRANLSALVRALHAEGPLSRSELGERTGLTRSGIRRLVGDLVAAGLVVEERGESLGLPGRPSPLVHLAPERAVVLALEIAVDSLAVAVVGLGGQRDRPRRASIGRAVISPSRTSSPTSASSPTAWRRRGSTIRSSGSASPSSASCVVTTASCRRRRTSGGAMSRSDQALAAAFGATVPIAVANEADLGALAEQRRGAAAGAEDVIFLSGEVGLGGGLIVGGRPLTGIAGFGGEVGHMPVNPVSGTTCRCGSIGCWETEVGEPALLARAGLPVDGGRAAVDAVLGAGCRRRRHGARRARRGRAVAGDRTRRPRQHAQPGARRARRPPGEPAPLRRRDHRRHARPSSTRRAACARRDRAGDARRRRRGARRRRAGVRADPRRSGGMVQRTRRRSRAGGSTWSQTNRGYKTHEQALADPSEPAPRGGDSHARTSNGRARHGCGAGAGRRVR